VFLEARPDGGVVSDVDLDFQLHGNYIVPLLSKTAANLAARVENGGFARPKLEF
jgi:hypothetical protein